MEARNSHVAEGDDIILVGLDDEAEHSSGLRMLDDPSINQAAGMTGWSDWWGPGTWPAGTTADAPSTCFS